ncbi:hypothetical protein BT67DRAFT_213276 [Trichocladium antarcticum]|uniref:Uncharacterized protein n=1 Tax=Trichocladium antarcticum TaxID=1450529 RepID=A0AAN6ZA44_9PEZI|nr:hypothetical protein BT67DRAFT_213276 [Trichocladium antarcticum]
MAINHTRSCRWRFPHPIPSHPITHLGPADVGAGAGLALHAAAVAGPAAVVAQALALAGGAVGVRRQEGAEAPLLDHAALLAARGGGGVSATRKGIAGWCLCCVGAGWLAYLVKSDVDKVAILDGGAGGNAAGVDGRAGEDAGGSGAEEEDELGGELHCCGWGCGSWWGWAVG